MQGPITRRQEKTDCDGPVRVCIDGLRCQAARRIHTPNQRAPDLLRRLFRRPALVQHGGPGRFKAFQGDALVVLIAGQAEDLRGVLVGGDGLAKRPHSLQGRAEVIQRYALEATVAGLAEDLRGILAGGDGLAVLPRLAQNGGSWNFASARSHASAGS
jgi:hypothetical protein